MNQVGKKIKRVMLASVFVGVLTACVASKPPQLPVETEPLPLKMAGYDFKRLEALAEGTVGVEGCNVTFEVSGIGDLNTYISFIAG